MLFPLIEDELQRVIPFNLWANLTKYNKKFTAVHSVMVLYRTITHPLFMTQLNNTERNILKWAALFHDISKRGMPDFEGKDHIHPFESAITTLKMFVELGIFGLHNSEEQ